MIRFLATQFDRFLNWLAPPIELLDVLGADDLADIEAQFDVYEPDDMWGCHQRFLASPSEGEISTAQPPFGAVRPAGTGSQASAAGVGGPFKSDEVLIEELVADYRDFLRGLFSRG